MKATLYDIQNLFLKNILCVLMLAMAAPVLAQDDETEQGSDDETEEVRRPVRKPVAEKYELMTVKGKVCDLATKQPLSGIQIKMLGNSRYAAMTEENGSFEIRVPVFATALYVYSPEYLSQQVAIGKPEEAIEVYMLSDKFATMYDENTHYTAARHFEATRVQDATIDAEIASRLGGDVHSIQRSGAPGNGNAMFIRGINSIKSNAMPLVVIDGIEQDMQYDRTSLHSGQFLNMLANIMPADVEKVTVLKNATALYGARGGNGVILIETKRGHSMATRIDANINVGYTLIPKLPSLLNASQYRNYATEMLGTIGQFQNGQLSFPFLNNDPTKPYYRTYHNDYDWTDETYRNALTQNYNINVQGGDNVGMYNLAVGYMDAKSTARENDFSRMNVRFNTDIYILPTLSTKFDIAIARTTSSVFDDGAPEDFTQGAVTSPTFLSLIKSPVLNPNQWNSYRGDFTELLSEADDLFTDDSGNELVRGTSLANPLAILAKASGVNKNRAENTNFHAMLEPTLQLGQYFSVTSAFNYSLNRNAQRYHRPYEGVPTFEIANLGRVTARFGTLFSNENSIYSNTHVDFKKNFGAHNLKAFAGFRYSYFSYDADQLTSDYKSSLNDKNPRIEGKESVAYFYMDGANDKWKVMQWYGNVDYDYMNRYFLTLSLNAEANSRFGSEGGNMKLFGVAWALFPSVQAGWVMTNERWFPKNTGINYLRLNVGYDLSGNDNISNYAVATSYNIVNYSNLSRGLQLTNIGNDKIKWETTRKFNAGLQTNLVNNRISLGFDYFFHKTSDLLMLKSFSSPVAGINRYWSNGGELQNEGFEANFSVKPVVTKDWRVEVGASVGHYKNKVTQLPNGNEELSSAYSTENNIITRVGSPVALFYGYKTNGVFASDADARSAGKVSADNPNGYLYTKDESGALHFFQAGDVNFVDVDGNGVIDADDKVVIGDPNPDIYGNIFASINWKNLTLAANFNYSLGNDVYNYQRMILNSGSNFYNQQVAVTNRWRYEGQQTDMPRLNYGDPQGNNRFSDRWIEDGSYLRLKTLTLTYRVPVNFSWLQGLSVWAEATNLFTVTRYLGSDPEFSVSNNVMYQGIDCGNLAQGRAFTIGTKINL